MEDEASHGDNWSAGFTKNINALDLRPKIFTSKDEELARSPVVGSLIFSTRVTVVQGHIAQ